MNPPKMPIHIGDLLRDTGHLRALLMGAYLLLLFHHWSAGELPDDDEQLAAISRLSNAEWKKARPILERFFQPGWKHGRVEKDLASARESYEKRAKAGEKGGKAKAEAKQSSSNATAGLKQPLTFNQEPNTKEEKKEMRVTALADGWPPDFREQFWARYPNKVGKPKAFSKLEHCMKRGISFAEIMNGLENYIAGKPDDRAWLNPETFINQERWADQPAKINGRRTVQQAADDLLAKLRAFEEPAPDGLCDGTGQNAIRLLPPN